MRVPLKIRDIRLQLNRGRQAIKHKSSLRWWLVYGPPRTGTSYMMRLIKLCSILYVSDWGLGLVLDSVPGWLGARSAPVFDYIRFDYDRFLRDISENILDNAYPGNGDQLDLVYKQATLRPPQYQTMVRMWGPPERAICCIREPAGYIASAVEKFLYATVEELQQVYVNSLNSYESIGGDVFDYEPELTPDDYLSFLRPLDLSGKKILPFQYRGKRKPEHTTEEMWTAYKAMKERAAS